MPQASRARTDHHAARPDRRRRPAARCLPLALLAAAVFLGAVLARPPGPALAAEPAPQLNGYELITDQPGPDGRRVLTYRAVATAMPMSIAAVNSQTGEWIVIKDGDTFPTGSFGIVAQPAQPVGAVLLALDDKLKHIEVSPPLSLAGDNGAKIFPVSQAYLAPGDHVLVVTPYGSLDDAKAGRNPSPATVLRFKVGLPPDQADILIKAGEPLRFAANQTTALECGGTWRVKSQGVPDGATVKAFGNPGKGLPRLVSTSGPAIELRDRKRVTLQQLAIVGDHTDGALRVFGGGGHVLDRCEVTGGSFGVLSEAGAGGARVAGVRFVGCDIHDNYHQVALKDGSGLFASETDGLVVDHCVFDGNGWDRGSRPDAKSVRCHAIYHNGSCGPIMFTWNVVADSAGHGAQIRAGGTVEHNIFWCNPVQLDFGVVGGGGPPCVGGVTGSVAFNVLVGGADGGKELGKPTGKVVQRGIPLELGNIKAADVHDNLINGAGWSRAYAAVNLSACKPDIDPRTGKPLTWVKDCVGIQDLRMHGNKVWDWRGPYSAFGYGAKSGTPGPGEQANLYVRPFRPADTWAPNTKAPNLAALLVNPAARVRAGERVEDLVAACVRAAESVQ